MDAADALRRMVQMSGKPSSRIARAIGRSDSFVRATISQGTRPRIDTFVQIAQACGYEVILRSEHDSFSFDAEMPAIAVEYQSSPNEGLSSQDQDETPRERPSSL